MIRWTRSGRPSPPNHDFLSLAGLRGPCGECQVEWDATGNLTLVSPAGTVAGRFGQGSLSNASCTVDALNSSLAANSAGWDVNLVVTFSNSFGGAPVQAYAYGENASGLAGPWMALGSWWPGGAAAQFVKMDTTTKGNWIGVYGADGYRMAALSGDYVQRPSYLTADPALAGQTPWQWANTSDAQALRVPGGSTRIEAAWYAAGSFTIDVPVADAGMHQIAVYCANYDGGQWPNRGQTVRVLDGAGNVLDTRMVSNFASGVWLVWRVKGHVQVQVTNTGQPNALASGIFFDGGAAPWVAFVKTDTTTKGAWPGVYGADGYRMAALNGDYVQRPAYLTGDPGVAGQAVWQWTASTSDAQALRVPGGTAGMEAAWYGASSFSIDVPVGDTGTHTVAVYCANYDPGSWPRRSQMVEVVDGYGNVLDARTIGWNAVTGQMEVDYAQGVWLVWTVSGRVQVRVVNTGTPNALVSAVMFGGTTSGGPVLSATMTHAGNFVAGQQGTYTVTVTNAAGAGPTSGTVTATENLPAGLTLVSMSGTGWSCASNVCSRSDSLAGGSSYPGITVTVTVSPSAGASLSNQVQVTIGSATRWASDPTTIRRVCLSCNIDIPLCI